MTKKNLPPQTKKTAQAAPSKIAMKTATPTALSHKVLVVEGPSPAELQLKSFEHAVRLFAQRKLAEARDGFVESAKGPAAHISDKARSYIQVCERRTAGVESMRNLSAEDHFNHGVERLNARDVEQARAHFGRALTQQPDADHILYTMALCCGLAGDGNGACENLKRAIHLEPRNRILARQDPEFLALASQFPALRLLLEPSF
jgi:tetratricopeptide (TPR) repeat protein